MQMTRRSLLVKTAAVSLAAQSARLAGQIRLPDKVRVAILGMDGHTGEILNPLPMLPDVEITAICDADPAALDRVARNPRVAQARRYADYRQMLDREKLDLVAICNNNGERAGAILACAERKLNLIAEKPYALDLPTLDRVRQAVEESGVRIGILLPMRFDPPYLAVKQIVDSGEIGEVAQIASQKSYKAGKRPLWMRRKETYGGTIPWIGIHMIDLMRWTSGREFRSAFSMTSRVGDFPDIGDMENVTASLFELDNGGLATLRMDYLRPETAQTHGDDRIRLAGTKGVVEYQASTGVTLITGGKKPVVVQDFPARRSLFTEFLESIYHGKPEPVSRADIYRTHEITLGAQEAAIQGKLVRF